MVALALRTPYESPWLMDSTAPEPGETAIRQDASKKREPGLEIHSKHRDEEPEGDSIIAPSLQRKWPSGKPRQAQHAIK